MIEPRSATPKLNEPPRALLSPAADAGALGGPRPAAPLQGFVAPPARLEPVKQEKVEREKAKRRWPLMAGIAALLAVGLVLAWSARSHEEPALPESSSHVAAAEPTPAQPADAPIVRPLQPQARPLLNNARFKFQPGRVGPPQLRRMDPAAPVAASAPPQNP